MPGMLRVREQEIRTRQSFLPCGRQAQRQIVFLKTSITPQRATFFSTQVRCPGKLRMRWTTARLNLSVGGIVRRMLMFLSGMRAERAKCTKKSFPQPKRVAVVEAALRARFVA